MGVPALGYLCRQVAKDNIDDLAYVGDFPYEQVEDLLDTVRSADQLAEIEENSPQIVDYDQPIWEKHVRKDFKVPHKRREKQHKAIYGPDSSLPVESWRDLHRVYKQEQEALHAESIRNLKLNMAKHQQAKSGQQSNLLDPRRMARLTASTNFRYSSSGGSFSRGWANNRNINAVQKARREAQQARQQRKVAIASINPTGPGGLPTRKLKIAPKGVRDQVRIQRQPLIAPRAPSKPQAPSPEEAERARREARLLAAKNPAAAGKQTAGGSPAKPGEVARPALSAASKKPAPPRKVDSTSLLFPNGSKAANGEQKVVVKTVSGSQNCANGSKATAAPATQQAPPDRARPTGGSATDRARGQVGTSNRSAEGRPVASSAVPAKRPAPPSSDGARSPPAPRSRKRRTEDLVFAKPKRR